MKSPEWLLWVWSRLSYLAAIVGVIGLPAAVLNGIRWTRRTVRFGWMWLRKLIVLAITTGTAWLLSREISRALKAGNKDQVVATFFLMTLAAVVASGPRVLPAPGELPVTSAKH